MTRSLLGVKFSFLTFTLLLSCAVLALSAVSVTAQRKTGASAAVITEEPSNSFHAYRGIRLGMTADEVRQKLGEPKDKGTEQDFYVFNESETAQIVYDKSQKVVTISADFLTATAEVLTAKQVFGEDVAAKPDGSVYKMVRFPKAGYWLSYSRTSGDSPMTSVTLQKIN